MEVKTLLDKVRDIVELKNIENENANMPEYVFTARQVKVAGEVTKLYSVMNLLSDRVRDAFLNNEIYIHDFTNYANGMHNCTLVDLGEILQKGFSTNNGDVRPPATIRSAMQLTAVILQCQSNVQFGGIAVSCLDYALAPYVKKSFVKHYKTGLKYIAGLSDEEIAALYGNYTFGFDDERYKELYPAVHRYARELTWEETLQSAEALIHNLNTLQSRAGDQLPFTSVNYGTDTSTEGRIITKAMLLATIKGVGKEGNTPIFPIQVFKYKKGVNDKEGTPNYDLKKLAIKCQAKRVYPNFVNVSADHFIQSDNPLEEMATMGCRTMLGVDRHGVVGYSGRGNISPVTINLTKIGIDYGIALGKRTTADTEGFYKELDRILDITMEALVNRFEYQGKQPAKSAPFMYENGMFKHDRKLKPNDAVREALKHGTLAVGILGVSNCMSALFGKHHGEDNTVYEFALNLYKYIDQYCKKKSDEYDLNFSVYSTPAESLCFSMWKRLSEQYGEIPGVLDRGYLNNSFHIPVYHKISIADKIKLEAPFHKYSVGGAISYVELDGVARNNLTALEQIVDYAMENNISYFAINHPIDTCTACGYEGIIGDTCPKCGGKDGQVFIKRLRRVTGYLTSSYKEFFNEGKRREVEDRYIHSRN